MFQKNESAFNKNVDFHLYRAAYEKINQKILSLKQETATSYTQEKLSALQLIKQDCLKNISEYNQNDAKFPPHEEKSKNLNRIFILRSGLFLINLVNNKDILEGLSTHRSYIGAINSRLPLIVGIVSGAVACSFSGPLVGVLGSVASAAITSEIRGIKGSFPESAKILFELMEGIMAVKNVETRSDFLKSKELPKLQWIDEHKHLPSDLCADNKFYFRARKNCPEVYIAANDQWMKCSFLTEKDIATLKQPILQNYNELAAIFLKVAIASTYKNLNDSLNHNEANLSICLV